MLAVLVCALVAIFWPAPATASVRASVDSRLGSSARIAEYTHRPTLTEPRLASGNYGVSYDFASDPLLRWKGRWHSNFGGTEVYDVRSRQWCPELGAFLSIDNYDYQDATSTLWGWPNQNPIRFSDPSGRHVGPQEVGVPTSWANTLFMESARANWDATAAWNAGNYFTAALQIQASFSFFGKATAASLFPRRQATGADYMMALCPIEAPAGVAAGASEATAASEAGGQVSLKASPKSLQKAFGKHGADLGMSGNWTSKRGPELAQAINQHVNDPTVVAIEGTYRNAPATHYFNPATGVNVVADQNGNFVTGFRLSADQMKHVLHSGSLW